MNGSNQALTPGSANELVRSVVLDAARGFSTRLGFYSPGTNQDPHVDALPGVSLVMAGAVQETVGSRVQTRLPGWVSVKPPGIRHSASVSPAGAIVLSVSIADAEQWELIAPRRGWEWRRLQANDRRLLLNSFASTALRMCRSELTFELLALTSDDTFVRGTPPAWLAQLAEKLTDQPETSIQSLASETGVHPVYFARAFRLWYGVPPSEYRLRARTSRALASALFRRRGAAEAAHTAGFADQSHMCRSIRSSTGMTLSRLRTLYDSAS